MGIPAFGAVLGEEFRDDNFAVDRDAAGAGAVSRSFHPARRRPAPLPYLDSVWNRDAGALDIRLDVLIQSAAMRERAGASPPAVLDELSTCVLDGGATRCSPHHQRLQFARRRSARDRNPVGTHAGRGRVAARVERGRQPAGADRRRRIPQISRGRRYRHIARLVREARRGTYRLWRGPRPHPAGHGLRRNRRSDNNIRFFPTPRTAACEENSLQDQCNEESPSRRRYAILVVRLVAVDCGLGCWWPAC